MFGSIAGAFWALVGAVSGSMALFFIIRYLIGYWVQKRYAHALAGFNADIDKHGALYILIAQLLPFTPTLLVTSAAGLSRLSWLQFLWSTGVGLAPGTLLYTWAGTNLHTIHSPDDMVTMALALGVGAVGLILLAQGVRALWINNSSHT